jgi:hypothetical protein
MYKNTHQCGIIMILKLLTDYSFGVNWRDNGGFTLLNEDRRGISKNTIKKYKKRLKLENNQ